MKRLTLSVFPSSRLAALLTCFVLGACASSAIETSNQLMAHGQSEAALDSLEKEMQLHPDDQELRVHYFRTRDQVITQALNTADRARDQGRLPEAETQAKLVLKLDRNNTRAQDILNDLAAGKQRTERLAKAQKLLNDKNTQEAETLVRTVLAESPNDTAARALLRKIDEQVAASTPLHEDREVKSRFTTPISLEFRDTPLRNVFEAMSRTAGINFVLDKDVKPDAKVTIFVRNTSIDEVMRLILTTNQLDRKVLNDNSVIIYPATTAKQKDYQELVTRTFYLTNTSAKQAQALIKTVVKTRDTFIDEGLNLLIIKDTPEAIRMAEQLVAQLDMASPEVMLEVEVLEIQRSRLLDLGIKYPDQVGYGILQPTTSTTTTTTTGTTTSTNLGGQLLTGNINLKDAGAAVPYISNPGATANLKDQIGFSNTLANPRIRVRNHEKAKILIGDKVPVFTTTSTANVGVSASVNYLDVGLKLDVEPSVRLDNDVEINVGLEVSSISKEVTGPQNSLAYQIGTRNASTVLRLRDGETQVLAGLISDSERKTTVAIPGLGSIPVIGRLFSDHSNNKSKTEIVLLITPHVVRNIAPPLTARAAVPAGTDNAVGAPPLTISTTTAGNAVTVRSNGTGGSTPTTPVTAPMTIAPVVPPATPAVGPASTGASEPAETQPTSLATKQKNAQTATASLTVRAPQNVRAGQTFTVTVSLTANDEVQSAEAAVNWDSALFEAANAETGNTVKLTPSGNSASGEVTLKAKANGIGDGMITLENSQITLKTGSVDQVTKPNPVTVKVSM
jgi:general secretion pathway protein D